MKHVQLLIVTTKHFFNPHLNNISSLYFPNISSLVDQNSTNHDPKIVFDYLITDQPSILSLLQPLTDNGWIITNYAFQTSIEHICFIGKENQSQLPIDQQYERALQHILQLNQ